MSMFSEYCLVRKRMADGIYDENDHQTLYTLYTKACESEFTTSQYKDYYNGEFKYDCLSLIQVQLFMKNKVYLSPSVTSKVSTCLFKLEHSAHKHRLREKKAIWSEWQRASSARNSLGLLPNEIIRIIILYVASSRHVEISNLIDARRQRSQSESESESESEIKLNFDLDLEDDY